MLRTVITGTGSYIPTNIRLNKDFEDHTFYGENKERLPTAAVDIVQKFKLITGIKERRYANLELSTSDIGALAAEKAILDSGIDRETIDQLIVAHNFGDVVNNSIQSDAVPSLASRIKHILGIKNPNCVAYDILFGCPGWIQGVIHADAFFKAGVAKKALVVGAETLSRVIDEYDRDSMIFSDGAAGTILEFLEVESDGPGIISSTVQTHSVEESDYINMGPSYNKAIDQNIFYIKMKGRKVYEYAMKQVPTAMKACLDKAGVEIEGLKKIFIHQANEKMDEGIIKRFYQLYNQKEHPLHIMPMSIHWLGNSSVATVPTLFDLVRNGQVDKHELQKGDVIMFASVGAGMNINAICYRYG